MIQEHKSKILTSDKKKIKGENKMSVKSVFFFFFFTWI